MAVLNMAKGLSKLGMEVYLLTFNTSKHYQDLRTLDRTKLPYQQIWTIDLNTSYNGATALLHYLSSSKAYHLKRFWSSEFCLQLIRIIKKHQFDLIQIEALYMLQYTPYIRKLSQCPIFYRAHNIEHQIWERKALNESNLLKKIFLKSISRRIKKFEMGCSTLYDHLIAISPNDRAFFDANAPDTPSLLAPVGIEFQQIDRPIAQASNSPLDLFYIGALDWMPNQEGLLWLLETCWYPIIQKHPNLTFSIAGRNAPKQLEEKLNTYPNVIYHGEVDDAVTYMHEHGILLVPLFSGSGMRVKIAEAMALGKTVITSPIGIEGIDALDGTEILVADTAERWISQIEKTINDSAFSASIGSNAIRFAQDQLDLNRITKNVIKFYLKHIV